MKIPTTTLWRFAFFLLVFSFFVLPEIQDVHAQESTIPSGTFSVQPAKVEFAVLPGESQTQNIQIANGTGLPLAVVVSYEDIAPKEQATALEEPVTLLGVEGGKYPLRELLSTPRRSFRLLSGETASVPVTVTIPRLATPGGHYGSVVFTFKPIYSSESSGPQNVAVESRLATLFFVRVAGEVKEEGELVKFGLFNEEKYLSQPGGDSPLHFQIAYANAGTVHLNPYGLLTVSPLLGGDVAVTIDPWVVLPGSTRMREVNVHDPLPPGFYTATLEQNRGYKDIIDVRTVTFWILPSIPQGFFVLLALFGFVWLIRRSLKLSKHFVSSTPV